MTAAALALALSALSTAALTTADLPGIWSGMAVLEGDSTAIALELDPADADGKMLLKGTIPVIHLKSQPFGPVRPVVSGDSVTLGPFHLLHDPRTGTLSGLLPAGLLPVYHVPMVLHRATALPTLTRVPASAPEPKVAWTFEARAPLWAGLTYANGVVYAGDDSGHVHALDAKTGRERWSFRTGGAIRGRALVDKSALWVASDDGKLYKLDSRTGAPAWDVPIEKLEVARRPIGDPNSIWDRYGSDPVLAGGRLYI